MTIVIKAVLNRTQLGALRITAVLCLVAVLFGYCGGATYSVSVVYLLGALSVLGVVLDALHDHRTGAW